MKALVAVCAVLLLCAPTPGRAWGWLAPAEAPEPEAEAPTAVLDDAGTAKAQDGACLAAIFAAERRYGIPDNLLLALGLQEAGWNSPQGLTIWPWSVNAAGEGRRFQSRAEALAFVRTRQAEGVESIDIGCLQVNLRWHPDAFATTLEGFDPARNVDYAARFLLGLYAETGDWWQAAGRYHSRNAGPQAVYLGALRRNHQVATARVAHFAVLAEAAGALELPATAFAALPSRTPTPYRSEGAIWGAALSGDEGGRRTLYSALDLEPILPVFLPPEG